MAKVFYKRALEQLAPMVGGTRLLEIDPWTVIDNARDEIVDLRVRLFQAQAELKKLRNEAWERDDKEETEAGVWDPKAYVPTQTPEEIRAAGHAWANERWAEREEWVRRAKGPWER